MRFSLIKLSAVQIAYAVDWIEKATDNVFIFAAIQI